MNDQETEEILEDDVPQSVVKILIENEAKEDLFIDSIEMGPGPIMRISYFDPKIQRDTVNLLNSISFAVVDDDVAETYVEFQEMARLIVREQLKRSYYGDD